jgi:hypothetical protein
MRSSEATIEGAVVIGTCSRCGYLCYVAHCEERKRQGWLKPARICASCLDEEQPVRTPAAIEISSGRKTSARKGANG